MVGRRQSQKFLILVVTLWLQACSFNRPVAYKCPAIIFPADPIPAVYKISRKSSPDEVMKAWVSTAVAYKRWNQIARKQVQSSK